MKSLRKTLVAIAKFGAARLGIPIAWVALFGGMLIGGAGTPVGYAVGHLVGHHIGMVSAEAKAAGEISEVRGELGAVRKQLAAAESEAKQAKAAASSHVLEHTSLAAQASHARAKLAACSTALAHRAPKPPARLELEDGSFVTKP